MNAVLLGIATQEPFDRGDRGGRQGGDAADPWLASWHGDHRSHFRLHTNDTSAPRKHYLDCTGTNGMIYVGMHLTDAKTSRA